MAGAARSDGAPTGRSRGGEIAGAHHARAVPRPRPDAGTAPVPAAETGPLHPATTPGLAALPPPPGQARGNEAASSPMTTRGCSVTMKCSWSVSRKCRCRPRCREVRLGHVGPVGVHALEPLHRHPVEARVGVAAVVVERPGVLLVAHHVTAALARLDQRAVDVAPVGVELGGRETVLAAQQAREPDHGTSCRVLAPARSTPPGAPQAIGGPGCPPGAETPGGAPVVPSLARQCPRPTSSCFSSAGLVPASSTVWPAGAA